jgi:hypothetical protein
MIGVVQPGGGDSKTKTDKHHGSHIKDFQKVRQFVARANVIYPRSGHFVVQSPVRFGPKADISKQSSSDLLEWLGCLAHFGHTRARS